MDELQGKVEIDGLELEIGDLLGKGKGGYTYKAWSERGVFAVKRIHYEDCGFYAFPEDKLKKELEDYDRLKSLGIRTPELIAFDLDRQILVKEFIPGETAAQWIAAGEASDELILEIFEMTDALYPEKLNIDYFPANFMRKNGKLFYVDYELSDYSREWDFERWGIWFYANQKGFEAYLRSGDQKYVCENAKPPREGLCDTVNRWLRLRGGPGPLPLPPN